RHYADINRMDALKQSVKAQAEAGTAVTKLPSTPPGLVLEMELDPQKVKIFDFHFDAELRADWEKHLLSYGKKDLGRGVVIELPGPKELMAGRGSAESYNDFFNKWAEKLKAERGIDLNEYQVIIGPEYRTKGSQIVIRDAKVAQELDEAARIKEIATDKPDPLNRASEILD